MDGIVMHTGGGMQKVSAQVRSFVERGGIWVLVQLALLVPAYLIPERTGRALPLAQLDVVGGFGLLLLTAGILQFSAGAFSLGPSLTPFPRPLEHATLRTTGAYSLVRHPIYGGLLFMAFGWSLYMHSTAGLVFDVVLFVFFDRKAAREERWLVEKFPDYDRYRQRVKRLIPGIY